jgi:hypothetical protein
MRLAFRGDPPNAAEARPHGMAVSNKPCIEVPVLFIPSNATWVTPRDIDLYSYLIFAHLELAQKHYKSALGTDTFKISREPLLVHHAKHDDAYYLEHHDADPPTGAKPRVGGMAMFAGGGTFNGAPNTGGGALELEPSSLLCDDALGFQAALVHELGHTLRMVHPDAYGCSISVNESNMSYNPHISSLGLSPLMFGRFNPEEFFTMAQNKRVFPDFQYVPAVHNPNGKKFRPVYFGCVNDDIGQRRGSHGKVCRDIRAPASKMPSTSIAAKVIAPAAGRGWLSAAGANWPASDLRYRLGNGRGTALAIATAKVAPPA